MDGTSAPVMERLFVGREEFLEDVRALLADPAGPLIVLIIGPAGEGKSRLIEKILGDIDPQQYDRGVDNTLFDFFNDGNRTQQGILLALAQRFEVSDDPQFRAAAEAYNAADLYDEAARSFHQRQMEKALVEALKDRLAGKRGLLTVDTVEEIAALKVGRWFFNFVGQFGGRLFVLAGSRPNADGYGEGVFQLFADLSDQGKATLIDLRAAPFTLDDTRTLLSARQDKFGRPEMAGLVEKIHLLTAGDGQPLTLALLIESLYGDPITAAEERFTEAELRDMEPKPDNHQRLRNRLIGGPMIADSGTPDRQLQQRLIRDLTHAYHGFDAEMVGACYSIAAIQDAGFDSPQTLLNAVARRPYIKTHRDIGVIRCHDRFREFAATNTWPRLDESLKIRQGDISAPLLPVLLRRVERAGEHPSPRKDRLTLEWLHHYLFVRFDPAGGNYAELWQLLGELRNTNRLDFTEQIVRRIEDVQKAARKVGQSDPVLERIQKLTRARLQMQYYDMPGIAGADTLAADVAQDPGGSRVLESVARALLGEALGDARQIDESIEVTKAALEIHAKLLNQIETGADLTSEHGLAQRDFIRRERYSCLNTIGFYERRRSNYGAAEASFQKAYDFARDEGDLRWSVIAAYQLCQTLRYRGEYSKAFTYGEIALLLSRQLDPQLQAQTLLVYGRLQRETGDQRRAIESYKQTYNTYRQVENERGQAEVLIELGWCESLNGNYEAADRLYAVAQELAGALNNEALLANLCEKQGKSKLYQAQALEPFAPGRDTLLAEAEALLRQGVDYAESRELLIYKVNCLVPLCRIAAIRGDFEQVIGSRGLREKIAHDLPEEKYSFGPAYAELEAVLAEIAFARSGVGQEGVTPNLELFDEATDHTLRIYELLVDHWEHLYRTRRTLLRRWLLRLPAEFQRRAADRLNLGWVKEPARAARHPGIFNDVSNILSLSEGLRWVVAPVESKSPGKDQ